MNQKIKTLIINSASNWIYMSVGIVIAFIMSPFIIHRLGDFKYGVWSLIMSFTGYFSILDLGMNRAIVRYVSKYLALNNNKKLNEVYNSALIFFSLIGLAVIIITAVSSIYFPVAFDIKTDTSIIQKVFIIIGLDFALGFPFSVFYAVLRGKQKHTVANNINILSAIIRSIAIYIALSYSNSLLIMAIIHIVANIFRYATVYIYIFLSHRNLKLISNSLQDKL